MRVISGAYRGLRLRALRGEFLHPTSDRMRETLFDVLGDRVREATFLDAYAGTGAVGIEALSRGARQVVFLENHRPAVELIRENLKRLGINSAFRLMAADVRAGIGRLEEEAIRFDYVFLDPPYAQFGEYHHVLRQLGRSTIADPSSVVIAEHSRRARLEERYGLLQMTRLLRHGDSQLGFYRKARPNAQDPCEGLDLCSSIS